MGSGLEERFIEHSQVVTTNNYKSLTALHTLKITVNITHKIKSSTSAFTSLLTRNQTDDCLTSWLINFLSLILRPTVSQPVRLGIKHLSGAYDQISITVIHLRVCWCGALSLSRGRVCRLQLLLVLANAVFFRSESRGTLDHILLSHIRDFPFRHLLRLAGLRWRCSTPLHKGHIAPLLKLSANCVGVTASNGSILLFTSALFLTPVQFPWYLLYPIVAMAVAFNSLS
jgi:hypothetical protein